MPELPEVETTLRALSPHLVGQVLQRVDFRAPKLRLPMPVAADVQGRRVEALERRAKYMLATLNDGQTLLMHLGMSGRFSIFYQNDTSDTVTPISRLAPTPLATHDHAVLATDTVEMRYNDPRRFGMFVLMPTATRLSHPLLADLGPEPLSPDFDGNALHAALRGRRTALKPVLMDARVVVGVGNIYAAEALFAAGIHPETPAEALGPTRCARLADAIRATLTRAIATGGSTLRDYRQPNGEAGHFQDTFAVYGHAGKPCRVCATPIAQMTQAQRSTFFCPHCQPHTQGAR